MGGSYMGNIFVLLVILFSSASAQAERNYADHNCNVALRHVRYSSGGSSTWNFAVDVREKFMLPGGPGEEVGVIWRVQGGAWKYLPLHSYSNHPHQVPGYRSFVGHVSSPAHPSMYLDVVAVVKAGDSQYFDHNFESGDTGFVHVDRSTQWQANPGANHCR